MPRTNRGAMIKKQDDASDMWGFMYKAFINNLKVDPMNFQLVTPFTSWDWSTQSLGHIDSREYDFISTVPQWSGVGAYASGGARLSDAYELFLMALVVSADKVQKQKIEDQQNTCADIRQDFERAVRTARDKYAKDSTVKDNTPDFSTWLTDPLSIGYSEGTTIAGYRNQLDDAMDLLETFIKQSNDPTIKAASDKLNDQQYWSSIDTGSLENAFTAPGYSKTESYTKWVQKVQAGGGNPATLGWSNSESHYDWKKSWAGAQASYGTPFWGIEVGGSWEKEDSLFTSKDISVEIGFQAWDTIQIQETGWFHQPFVNAKCDGEYRLGYEKSDFFGEKGAMALRKTGMLVVYKPSFTIKSKTAFTKIQKEKFEASGGLRIGPFKIGGGGGSSSIIEDKAVTSNEFSGTTNSEVPFIAGITVQKLGK